MSYISKIIIALCALAISNLSFASYHSNTIVTFHSSSGYHSNHYYHRHHHYRPYHGPVHVEEYYYAEPEPMTNSGVGSIIGAIAGGLIGSTVGQGNGKILAIAAGSVAGAVIGGSVGRNMDENDQLRVNQALEKNPVGQPSYWRNQHSGIAYDMVPVRDVNYHGNKYCREFRTTAIINGKKQAMYGTACRQPDGAWKVVK